MRLGLHSINLGPCADPALQIRVARAAEAAGFDSVWTGEHVVVPTRDNPVPVPPETPFLDTIVTLTHIAAHTTRLRLGAGVLVLPHHNPLVLAKALTSLDIVSGGRLIAGFASGYVQAEFAALGVSFADRGRLTDEAIAAIRALWTEPEPRYQGRFVSFRDVRFEPKPRQRPHPPIVIGGHAEPALRRAARDGDGWYAFGLTVADTAPLVRRLRELRPALRPDAPPLEISLSTFEPITAALIEQAAAAGIDRLVAVPLVPADEIEAMVRELGKLAGRSTKR